jgi:hypothetical protein
MSTVDGTVPSAAEVEALRVAYHDAADDAFDASADASDARDAWYAAVARRATKARKTFKEPTT